MSHSHNQPPATTGHAAITKHADTSVHRTQKSFKSDRRDKPKHSGKIVSGPKKGGGGGGTVWGKPGDEVKGFEEDPNDPNYDPNDYVMDWEPSDSTAIKFASSLADFAKFKSTMKEAAHRSRISSLVASLCKNGFITNLQMAAGARKLYNSLPDISLDVPNAKTLIREQISFAVAGGLLDANAARTLELEQEALADTKAVDSTKAKIHSILAEFFRSEDLDDTVQSLKELNAPHLAFETVKKLISLSLDLGNRQREGASVFLSDSRGYLQLCDIEKGFTILLERVDDMINDVPQLLKHLSIFIARAVVDEALPPAFLVRVDLNANDLGSRVLQQAQVLLNQEAASDRLIYCWEDEEEEEQEKRTPKSQTNSTEELAQFAPAASSSGTSTSASEAK